MTSSGSARHGFTMAEVLVGASLSLVVFAVAFTALIRFSRVHYSLVTQADLDREFRYAINFIVDDIRGLQSIEVERPTDEEAETGELPEVLISLPNIEPVSGAEPDRTEVVYRVTDSGELRRIYAEYSSQGNVIKSQTNRLIDGVIDFDIERVSGSSVFEITLSSNRVAGGKDYKKALSTRIASRN